MTQVPTLSTFGALGGALLAQWLSQALVAFLSTDNRRLFVDLSPDWRVFLFIVGLAVTRCMSLAQWRTHRRPPPSETYPAAPTEF